jgi:hypothetical protein
LATILNLHEQYGSNGLAVSSQPWALSPIEGAQYRDTDGMLRIRTVPELGLLATSMSAEPNRSIVHRSWGLIDGGMFYGPTFRYSEYMRVRNTFMAILANLALAAANYLLSLSPVRSVPNSHSCSLHIRFLIPFTVNADCFYRSKMAASQSGPYPRQWAGCGVSSISVSLDALPT